MSLNDLANSAYTNVSNTIVNESVLNAPVTDLALQGKDASLSISTSSGAVTQQVTPALWQQAAASQLLINNSAGANSINLIATASSVSDTGIRGFALQDALGIQTVGSAVLLKIFRTGAGTATVAVNGTTVMTSTGTCSLVAVEATARSVSTGSCEVAGVVIY